MHWASFDTFLIEDTFWQDKMGKPSVNREFISALLTLGSFDSYSFFCADRHHLLFLKQFLERTVPEALHPRVNLNLQANFMESMRQQPVDVMHHGDFTYHTPHMTEFRNQHHPGRPFAITGVTHSLNRVWLHTRFLQILLAGPQSYDSIVCTSQCAIEMLRRSFDQIQQSFKTAFSATLPSPPQLVHIPLALSDNAYTQQDRAHCRQLLGLSDDRLVILSFSRFSIRSKMDPAPFLESIQWLHQNNALPEFTLILAGAGEPAALRLINQMVAKLGLQTVVQVEDNVEFDRKMRLYGAADIFVSLVDNYQETFGLTIMEAMAQGVPVVATDFDGYRDLVEHAKSGFLIPTCSSPSMEPWETLKGLVDPSILGYYQSQKVAFDMPAFIQALETLASDRELRHQMGARGRAKSQAYRWPRIIDRYEALWRGSAGRVGNRPPRGLKASGAGTLLNPSWETCFAHFTTQRLSFDHTVALSEYGRQRCDQNFQPVLYEETSALLDDALLMSMLGRLSNQSWRLGELCDRLASETGRLRETVLLHLDWLLKHGYLHVDPMEKSD